MTEKKMENPRFTKRRIGARSISSPSNVLAKFRAWFHDSTVFTPQESATGK